jgi:hypothetical protein
VYGMAHVLALNNVRSRVLRGNVSGHRLPAYGCVGLTRTSVPLRGGCMSHPIQFGIWPMVTYVLVNELLWRV